MRKSLLFVSTLCLISFFSMAQGQIWSVMKHPITGYNANDSYRINTISIDSEANIYCSVRKEPRNDEAEELFVAKLSDADIDWQRIALFDQKNIKLLPCSQDGRAFLIKYEPESKSQVLSSEDAGQSWQLVYQSEGTPIISCFRASSGKTYIVTRKEILESAAESYEFSSIYTSNKDIDLASIDEDRASKCVYIGLRFYYDNNPEGSLPEEVSQIFSYTNNTLLDITGTLKQSPIRQLLVNEKGELICINTGLITMGGSMWIKRAEGNWERVQAFGSCFPEYASMLDGNRLAVSTLGKDIGIDGRYHLALTDASDFAPTWQTDSELASVWLRGQAYDRVGKHLYAFGANPMGQTYYLLKSVEAIGTSMIDIKEEATDLAIHIDAKRLRIESKSPLSHLRVFAMDGQVLQQKALNGSLIEELSLDDLPRGVYLIHVMLSSGKYYSQKCSL